MQGKKSGKAEREMGEGCGHCKYQYWQSMVFRNEDLLRKMLKVYMEICKVLKK